MVSCPEVPVHDTNLLLVMRSLYHIHLTPSSPVVEVASKASLVQLMRLAFERYELCWRQFNAAADRQTSTTPEAGAKAIDPTNGTDAKTAKTKCVVCSRRGTHTCLETKMPVCSLECKMSNLALSQPVDASGHNPATLKVILGARTALANNDCFLLFRSLCKLAAKALPEAGPQPVDPMAVKSKTVALELILSVVDRAGAAFRSARDLIAVIRDDLVLALLKNSVLSGAGELDNISRLSSSVFIRVIGPRLSEMLSHPRARLCVLRREGHMLGVTRVAI
jgi:hypothetical protein